MGAGYVPSYKDDHREFNKKSLEDINHNNPFTVFDEWFKAASEAEILDYNAVAISTSNKEGRVSSRIVYLKDVIDNSFCFYTNYNSKKGQDLIENPKASFLFFWKELERQVRIEGTVVKADPKISDDYFYARPKASQIGALASDQSAKIESRKALEQKFEDVQSDHENKDVKRPDNWGGYLLIPDYFEFWQGREARMHDRIGFELKNDVWETFRLNP